MRLYTSLEGVLYVCTKDLDAPTQADSELNGYRILMTVS